ncbi:MAG: Holliday junction resolvase RuvX [Anaerolineae bacterium]|nr:MAG: Holliday junction resolvase RuvX [Anaerolineae bacterium]
MTVSPTGDPPGRILALDVGERRIGVAVSDESQTLARGLTVLHRRSKAQDFEALAQLAHEQEALAIVVGLPLSLDGSEGPQARQVRHYADALAEALAAQGLAVPLIFWDESLSTVTAAEIMIASGRKRRHRRSQIDAVAAAVILQNYLDTHSSEY